MVEPFKNVFNLAMVTLMAKHFSHADGDFDRATFIQIATNNMQELELKARSSQICDALEATLPQNYRLACEVILQSLHPDDDVNLSDLSIDENGLRGWALMPVGEYVARRGVDDFDYSMGVLRELTKRSSAEFDVRTFILANTSQALRFIQKWAVDENYHVRRLASEGSRPRLPWGFQLPVFIRNPELVLPILEALKDDPHEYVRRSVANNLNDISKDHPHLVAKLMTKWMKGASSQRKKLIRHALRTLIKAGNKQALKALGYGRPKVEMLGFNLLSGQINFGEKLQFDIDILSLSSSGQPLIIDYVIHHMRANGKTTPKVFKWKNISLNANSSLKASRNHAIKLISTRRYYAGKHYVEIIINGVSFGRREFILNMD